MDPHSDGLRRSKKSIMKVKRQLRSESHRKNRKLLSCAPCRRRKVKCDRAKPCNQCIRSKVGDACEYSASPAFLSATSPSHQFTLPLATFSSPPPAFELSTSTQQDEPLHPDRPWAKSNLDQYNGRLISTHRSTGQASTLHFLPLLGASTLGHGDPSAQSLATSQQENPLSFRGKQQRTRFFGRSHWATSLQMFPDLMDHIQDYRQMKEDPSASKFNEYLSLKRHKHGRRSATKHCIQSSSNQRQAHFVHLLPSRQLSDYLLQLYLSTYETTHRVVHVPSFLQEWTKFWSTRSEDSDRSCAAEILLAKVLTMMACASCLADDASLEAAGSDRRSLSQMCREWVQAVVLWLSPIPDHARLNLHVMQVKCLLLIARQATAWDGDLVSVTTGSLIREAVMMGLHRDPANFPNMNQFWAETRKRLWFTVVELELQTSLHLGIPLTLSWEDFDCPPPLNVEDEDFSHGSTSTAPGRDIATPTRTTFQIVLAQSLQVRMEIARLINRIRFTVNSKEITGLSDSLASSMEEAPRQLRDDPWIESTNDEPGRRSAFQGSLYLFIMWRSVLALHRPVLLNLGNVEKEMFLVSRRDCLQASVALLAQLEYLSEISDDISLRPGRIFHPHVLCLKGGLFQDDIFHAAITVCFELRLQLNDCRTPLPTGPISNLVSQSALYHRMALLQSIENALKYFENKVRGEARACKTFTTLCILYLSIKSQFPPHAISVIVSGEPTQQKVLTVDEACPLASRRCRKLLLEGDAFNIHHISSQIGHQYVPPIKNHVSVGMAPLNACPETDPLADMPSMEMSDPSGLTFQDMDFDWTMLLDPLPPYPVEGWPSTDPSV